MHYKFTALYISLIVAVNYAFSVVPLVELPDGTMWPPVALAVGFIFVVRDFAQREIGHKVLLAMLVGLVISYFMADPFVATASAAAAAAAATTTKPAAQESSRAAKRARQRTDGRQGRASKQGAGG